MLMMRKNELIVLSVLLYTKQIYVAVGTNDLQDIAFFNIVEQALAPIVPGHILTLLPISFWGSFCPALNAIVSSASRDGLDCVLFQSVEMKISTEITERLRHHLYDTGDADIGGEDGTISGNNTYYHWKTKCASGDFF